MTSRHRHWHAASEALISFFFFSFIMNNNNNNNINNNNNREILASKKARRWCFTSFKMNVFNTFKPDKTVKYCIMGKEKAPKTNKEHLQGYIKFNNNFRFSKVKKILGDETAHCEISKGTDQQNITYCKKDGNYKEWGISRKRKDCKVSEIRKLIKKKQGDWVILDQSPELFEQFIKLKKIITDTLKEKDMHKYNMEFINKFKPNELQTFLLLRLEKQNDRTITWAFDKIGNTGKTYLSKYLCCLGAIRFTNGKSNDIAYAYNGQEIIIFDFTRSLEGYVNYSIIEELKNGMIFSGKYESKFKTFKTPKILCLSNWMPKLSSFSFDRWDIVDVQDWLKQKALQKIQKDLEIKKK